MNKPNDVDAAPVHADVRWLDVPIDVGWHWKATRYGDEGEVIAVYVSHVLLRQYRSIGDMRGKGVRIMYLPVESPQNPLF